MASAPDVPDVDVNTRRVKALHLAASTRQSTTFSRLLDRCGPTAELDTNMRHFLNDPGQVGVLSGTEYLSPTEHRRFTKLTDSNGAPTKDIQDDGIGDGIKDDRINNDGTNDGGINEHGTIPNGTAYSSAMINPVCRDQNAMRWWPFTTS